MKNYNFVYKYHISFRISHPTRDLSETWTKLQEIPSVQLGRMWKVGDPKKTPKGQPLEGVYKNSYLYFEFDKEWQSALLNEDDLPEAIETFVDKLYPYKELLQELVATGGALYFYIGCAFERGAGMDFHDELIAKLADLKISFGINFYPSDDEGKKWGKKNDEIEARIEDVVRRYDLSGIIAAPPSELELKYAYDSIIQDVAQWIEAGIDEERMAKELKVQFEYFERTKSDKLPKTVDGYRALAHELAQIKWDEGDSII